MRITTAFESGRIEVRAIEKTRAIVAVPHDQGAPDLSGRATGLPTPAAVGTPRFRQWFAFDVEGAPGDEVEVVIENAGQCTWADGLGGDYRVYASEGPAWRRVDSRLEGHKLVLKHKLERSRVRLAYYPPYPASRLTLLRRRMRAAGGHVQTLGSTPDGRPVDVFVFPAKAANGSAAHGQSARPPIWIIAQQHPGEAMAGWFAEGLIETLSSAKIIANELLACGVNVVPRMNPDGIAVGNHRTTPRAEDLNRAWGSPAAPKEVSLVREAIRKTGATLFLDVHGDERLPWVFAQHADAYPSRPDAIVRGLRAFDSAMLKATADFQVEHKYPYDASGRPSTAFASNWAQHELQCPAITLEMPFSDHRGRPDPRGFFPARARRLGRRAVVGILAAVRAFANA